MSAKIIQPVEILLQEKHLYHFLSALEEMISEMKVTPKGLYFIYKLNIVKPLFLELIKTASLFACMEFT